jgi:hypothetical protein
MQLPEPWSQQPVAQFCGLQPDIEPVHTWFVQVPFETPQFEQKSPILPHLSVWSPISHRPVARSTQPMHGWQAPATQVCLLGHAMQAAPPRPQRAVVGGF